MRRPAGRKPITAANAGGRYKSTKKMRKCLKCGNDFLSLGRFNRICSTCDIVNNHQSARARNPARQAAMRRGKAGA